MWPEDTKNPGVPFPAFPAVQSSPAAEGRMGQAWAAAPLEQGIAGNSFPGIQGW